MESTNIIPFPKIEQREAKIQKSNDLSSKLEEIEYNLKKIQFYLEQIDHLGRR